MNIFRQFIYRNLGPKYRQELYSEVEKYGGPDGYDLWIDSEIGKYLQNDFIFQLKREIEEYVNEMKIGDFKKEQEMQASLMKYIIFDTFIFGYMKDENFDNVIKNTLTGISNFIEQYYKDTNSLALVGMKKHREKFGY